nr:transposase [Endozoicomonas euniceicola]
MFSCFKSQTEQVLEDANHWSIFTRCLPSCFALYSSLVISECQPASAIERAPPKLAISVMVNNLKSTLSRRLRMLNTHLTAQSKAGLMWSRSYFACSAGGATIETLKDYVNSQSTPD